MGHYLLMFSSNEIVWKTVKLTINKWVEIDIRTFFAMIKSTWVIELLQYTKTWQSFLVLDIICFTGESKNEASIWKEIFVWG